ncbi:hypothetical protein HZA57_03160 [Candidatus Poribacteria bacterium]|nr:hypothetical protein [Candidatus Poribacteria bacterium]
MILIAHRGGAAYALENSRAAVVHACTLNIDAIEIDVQATSDGALIVFHDDTLDRLTNARGPVAEWNFAQLRRDVRLVNGEPIPLLAEIAEAVSGSARKLFVELKPPGIEEDVLREVLAHLPPGRLLVGSFHHPSVRSVKQLHPQIETIALVDRRDTSPAAIAGPTGCDFLGPARELVDHDLVSEAHTAGLRVLVWTVNDAEEAKRLAKAGVDGLISDDPVRLRAGAFT